MAGSEPLIQEADRHITKLAIEAQMYDKDGPKKEKKIEKRPPDAITYKIFALFYRVKNSVSLI